MREGEGVSTRPTAQCQVRMKVRGSLQSGGVVDRHSSLEFTIGDGDVIQGTVMNRATCIILYTSYRAIIL